MAHRTTPEQAPHGMFDVDYRSAVFKESDGVTYHVGSDAHAATVISVSKSGKRVTIQIDKATRDPSFVPNILPGGFVGHCTNQNEQTYTYERDPDGQIVELTLRTWRGIKVWAVKGQGTNGHSAISHGRREFYDYNF